MCGDLVLVADPTPADVVAGVQPMVLLDVLIWAVRQVQVFEALTV